MKKYLLLDVFCNSWWSHHRVLLCGISFSAAFTSPPDTDVHTCYFAHQHMPVHCQVLAWEWHETPGIPKQSGSTPHPPGGWRRIRRAVGTISHLIAMSVHTWRRIIIYH